MTKTTLTAFAAKTKGDFVDKTNNIPAFTTTARLQLRVWLAGLGALQPGVALLRADGRALDATDALTLLLRPKRALGHMLACSAALWSACMFDMWCWEQEHDLVNQLENVTGVTSCMKAEYATRSRR
jgi:hypothetical protein